MAIVFDENGKYVDEKGLVKLDPTKFADWQIAEEAEKSLPSVDFFREKLGLLPEEIIPYGKTPKIDFIKVMKRLENKPDGKFIEVTAVTPTPFGEGKSTVEDLRKDAAAAAEIALRTQATVDRIAELENISVSDQEIYEALVLIAKQNNMTVEQIKPYCDEEFRQAIIKSVLTSKVMHLIRDAADIAVV